MQIATDITTDPSETLVIVPESDITLKNSNADRRYRTALYMLSVDNIRRVFEEYESFEQKVHKTSEYLKNNNIFCWYLC